MQVFTLLSFVLSDHCFLQSDRERTDETLKKVDFIAIKSSVLEESLNNEMLDLMAKLCQAMTRYLSVGE